MLATMGFFQIFNLYFRQLLVEGDTPCSPATHALLLMQWLTVMNYLDVIYYIFCLIYPPMYHVQSLLIVLNTCWPHWHMDYRILHFLTILVPYYGYNWLQTVL